MCGFIAQLVEQRTGRRVGDGFESRWSPDFFFQASSFQYPGNQRFFSRAAGLVGPRPTQLRPETALEKSLAPRVSFQLLKLENLLLWSFFTFIYNRSSKMNYFIYTSHQYYFWLTTKPTTTDNGEQTTTLLVHHAILYISLPSLYH